MIDCFFQNAMKSENLKYIQGNICENTFDLYIDNYTVVKTVPNDSYNGLIQSFVKELMEV